MEDEILSRQEAIRRGLSYYYTGLECPQGHICKRSVHNCTCYICNSEAGKLVYAKERSAKSSRKYYNSNKLRCRKKTKNWQNNNKGHYRSLLARYRAKKLNATPKWSQLEAITKFYKDCPTGMAVDHIVPLQGKLVSGLHVIENLQYLSKSENSSKGNKFEPEHTFNSQEVC